MMRQYGESSRQFILAHHGILGQKWGIRRYQNTDGTLTTAGKNRYGDSSTSDKGKDSTESKKQVSKRNQKKSQEAIDQARKTYGSKKYSMELEKDKKYLDTLKKDGVEGYNDIVLGGQASRKEAKRLYDEDVDFSNYRINEGERLVKNSKMLEKQLSSIDVTSKKYKDVQKEIDTLVNDLIGNSTYGQTSVAEDYEDYMNRSK